MSVDVVTRSDPVEMDVLLDWRTRFNMRIPSIIPRHCSYCYREPVSCLNYGDDIVWLCRKHHILVLVNLKANE